MKIKNFNTYYNKSKKIAESETEHYKLFMIELCKDLEIEPHSEQILNGEVLMCVIYDINKTLRSFCNQQYINYRMQFELFSDVRCGNYDELTYPV
jgi:hypothetical protein